MTAHDWNDDCICTRCGYDSVEWWRARKAGHTPGPWLYRGKSASFHAASETHPYGESLFAFQEGCEPSDANFRLIEAAPDLLEALRLARRMCGLKGEVHRIIDAAIAKATTNAVEMPPCAGEDGKDE